MTGSRLRTIEWLGYRRHRAARVCPLGGGTPTAPPIPDRHHAEEIPCPRRPRCRRAVAEAHQHVVDGLRDVLQRVEEGGVEVEPRLRESSSARSANSPDLTPGPFNPDAA